MAKQYTFPVKHFEDNLIFSTDGSVWAVYEMRCEEYDMLSETGKDNFIDRLARFIASIGDEAKILILPVKQDIEPARQYSLGQIERGYSNKHHGKAYTYAKHYVNESAKLLEKTTINGGGANDYKVYIVTKLKKPHDDNILKDILDNPAGMLEESMGIGRNLISRRDVEVYSVIADRYQKQQSTRFGLDKVDSDTIQWLIGRMFLRGTVDEPFIRKNPDGSTWLPSEMTYKFGTTEYIKPDTYGIMSLYNYKWRQKHRNLEIEDEDGNKTYQTFLSLSHMPPEIQIPGGEWLKPLLDLPFGVETCISIKTINFKAALKKLEENRRRLEGQDLHARESGEMSEEDIDKAYSDSMMMKKDLEVYNDPLVDISVIVCIADTSEEDLRTRITLVRQTMEGMQFRLQRPVSDCLKCFYAMIPGASVDYAPYWHKMTPNVAATSVFPVAIESGDDVGHFIGIAGERRKYVFLALAEAIRNNRSGGTAILGTLGGGKSVLANLLGYQVTLLDGGRSLFIDPKSERGDLWEAFMPEFRDEIGITTIDWRDKGVFDPFVIYKPESKEWFQKHKEDYEKIPGNIIHTYKEYRYERMQRAKDLANSMFIEELGLNEPSKQKHKLAFQEALDEAAKYKNASMELVIRLLMNRVPEKYQIFDKSDDIYMEAQLLGREMQKLQSTNRLANLIIGNGTEKGLSFNKRINIMQIQGLTFPDPNTSKKDYSASQRTSATIMIPLGEFAREFTTDPLYLDTPKAVVFDESWFLKSTAQGKLLYSEIARTGRSFFSIPIFIGHSISDVDEPGIREALTYKFIFKMATEKEAKAALDMLQLEDTPDNINLVMNLGNGECLFSDFEGRVQKIRVVILFNNLLKAFETNPEKKERLFKELRERKGK